MAHDSSGVRAADREFARRLAILVPGWTLLFLLASLGLVLYGDVLMALFT